MWGSLIKIRPFEVGWEMPHTREDLARYQVRVCFDIFLKRFVSVEDFSEGGVELNPPSIWTLCFDR